MAFDISSAQGYGAGTADVTNPSDTINTYARVTAVNDTQIALDDATGFSVGGEILLHDTAPGRWLICSIVSKSSNVLTLNKSVTLWDALPDRLQAVTIPHYKTLKIERGNTLSPAAYDSSRNVGGILVFKCSESLTLAGNIVLTDKGLPVGDTSFRRSKARSWEEQAVNDTDKYSGYENATMPYYAPLNCGDGLAFIITKNFIRSGSPRIGNPNAAGVRFMRGSSADSVTNVGGSTILLVAETLTNFAVNTFSKYRARSASEGYGLARCYIASNTTLTNDEALYSYDIISDPTRLKTNCNISGFGSGTSSKTNPTVDINQFARVVRIDDATVTYADKSDDVDLAQKLVIIHFKNKTTSVTADSGRFWLSKVLSDDGSKIVLKDPPPSVSLTDYSAQIVRVPQYKNFTLNQTYDFTRKFDGAKGGIFAICVKGECDLRDGIIDMRITNEHNYGVGGGAPYNVDNNTMTFGNAHNHSRLPIGEGLGSILIIAKTLKLNNSSRLGASWSGNAFGGGNDSFASGGWKGNETVDDAAGSGKGGGYYLHGPRYYGGYGSNAYEYDSKGTRTSHQLGEQGAHLFLVADTIDGLCLANISTGGEGNASGQQGGAGYGGGTAQGTGGYLGGAAGNIFPAGGSGFAFFYCNNFTNLNTENIV